MLDRNVDYYRQVVVVVIVAVGAYWSTTLATEVLLPWTLFLFGGAIIYTLVLPYKKALLVEGRWGLPARAKALTVILMGLPFYLIPSVAVLFSPSLAETLPTFHYLVASFQFIAAFDSLVMLLAWFLVGGLLASILTAGLGIRYILKRFRYGELELNETLRYATDRTGRIELGFSLALVFAALHVIAGWASRHSPNISQYYYLSALVLVLLLVVYGHFFVTYTPSVCPSWSRRFLEMLLFLSIIVTAIGFLIGIVFAITAMVYLHLLSKRGRGLQEFNVFIDQKKKEEMEERKKHERKRLDQDWRSYYFYKLYPRAEYVMFALLFLGSLLIVILPAFGCQIGIIEFILSIIMFGVVYSGIPRGYFLLKEYRKELDDVKKRLDSKKAGGAFDLIL